MNETQLNHLYLVINEETYEAIKTSNFIHTLAHCYEKQTGADKEVGWKGFYICGQKTYIELFVPQERFRVKEIFGIGLGVDANREFDLLIKRSPI